MKTITFLIDNSDNKLSQEDWSEFAAEFGAIIGWYAAARIYFSGFSNPNSKFQNAAWVVTMTQDQLDAAKISLKNCRERFRQDSVAIVEGVTTFI